MGSLQSGQTVFDAQTAAMPRCSAFKEKQGQQQSQPGTFLTVAGVIAGAKLEHWRIFCVSKTMSA
jgi:hypothetical protein